MAVLQNNRTKEKVVLLGEHLFGRQVGESNTVLTNPKVSRMHAWIIWGVEGWFLQDSSTNGTFVNDSRIYPGTKIRLKINDLIKFGGGGSDYWMLLNVDAPKTMLLAITKGLSDIVLDDIVALPSEVNPEVTIYVSPEGQWVCESQSGISYLKSGDRVGIKDSVWRFVEAAPEVETLVVAGALSAKVSSIQSIFSVSQNEEHVSLRLIINDQELDLKQRTHHYLMLMLARKRLEDEDEGFQIEEQGWMDKAQLGRLMGLNETHINIQVYRFRKQLIKALPSNIELPQLIETRRGEIRFAAEVIKICGGLIETVS